MDMYWGESTCSGISQVVSASFNAHDLETDFFEFSEDLSTFHRPQLRSHRYFLALLAFGPVFTFNDNDRKTPPFSVVSLGGTSFPSSCRTSIRPLANSLRLARAFSAVAPQAAGWFRGG